MLSNYLSYELKTCLNEALRLEEKYKGLAFGLLQNPEYEEIILDMQKYALLTDEGEGKFRLTPIARTIFSGLPQRTKEFRDALLEAFMAPPALSYLHYAFGRSRSLPLAYQMKRRLIQEGYKEAGAGKLTVIYRANSLLMQRYDVDYLPKLVYERSPPRRIV